MPSRVLEAVAKHRVVALRGETGCGKSSRLPVMLLEDAAARGERVLVVCAQPRRLAAHALYEVQERLVV